CARKGRIVTRHIDDTRGAMDPAATRYAVTRLPTTALGTPPWEPPAPLPQRPLPARCHMLVIGGGITGLAAALRIARRNRDVVVVEHAFGSGATSRSGGIILGDTLVGAASEFDGCERALREWIT